MAAPARIHRCDELHTRREGDVRIRPCNADIAGLERLPKQIQNTALEFWQLVEEQDAEVSKADLTRPNAKPAADQRGHGSAMVRRPERPAPHHPPVLQLAGDRSHHRDFERLGRLQRRQDARKARREQRLPGPWRTAHQQIVTAGRRDLERALGDFLALHLLEVRPAHRRLRLPRLRRRQHRRAFQVREQAQAGPARRRLRHRPPMPPRRPERPGRSAPCPADEACNAASSTPGDGAIRPSSLSSPTIDIMRQAPRHRRHRSPPAGKARSAGRNASLPSASPPATGSP